MVARSFSVALVVATLITVATLVVVLLLGPPFPRSGDVLTPLAAWSAYFTMVATSLLVVGAALAAVRVGHQISQAEEAHRAEMKVLRKTYELSVLPLVIVSRADFENGRITLGIQNVGLGPATDVVLRIWLFPTADHLTDAEIEAGVRADADSVGATDPAVSVNLPGVAAGGEFINFVIRANKAKGWDAGVYTQGYFIYSVECKDGLRDQHSTNSPWNPGFVRVAPAGGVDIP